ncbi:MAG TPA: Cof-type HAD-IIB family hydrolase [Blastocatellia bacterium]|nr:Cof-type HAD-IIB family hydrolase [Blastocatellia bacterium]
MAIKLLALDIDGTLLTPRGELSARNQAALHKARLAGVEVVLVTGRRFDSARLLLQDLRLELPVISHNGALSKDPLSLETFDLHSLEVEVAREIVLTARGAGIDMICCWDEPLGVGVMVFDYVSETNVLLRRYLEKYRDSVVEVADLIGYIDRPPIQIMFSGPCEPMDRFAEDLQSVMRERIQIFKTRYPAADLTILDALSVRASKGQSLAKFAGQRGIAREEVMAIGDNHNDLPMLQYAGLGVLMANAEEELKQMGFVMTSSNNEDGVAEAIEKFILQKEPT